MQLHYKNMALNKDNTRVQTREIDASFDLQQKPQEHGLESRREKQMPVLVFSKTVQERIKRKDFAPGDVVCVEFWTAERSAVEWASAYFLAIGVGPWVMGGIHLKPHR